MDLLTLAGDIFDTVEDADALRPVLRSKFSNLDFEIIAIPGNHDIDAYSGNLNFGARAQKSKIHYYKIRKHNQQLIARVDLLITYYH